MLNKNSKIYLPERVYVSASALEYPRTTEIIDRIKKYNPKVGIINISGNTPERPDLVGRELYDFLGETIVLCTRTADYMEVFASPGNISENLGVVGKLSFHCVLQCAYCYLQVAGQGTPWNRVYVDLENFYEQSKRERLVYRMIQTLWSTISFFYQDPLNKVPKSFKAVCDNKIRREVLKKKTKLINGDAAIKYLEENLYFFFKEMEIELTKGQYEALSQCIPLYYKENSKFPLSINISEYSDLVALDPLTNILDELMQFVQKDPDFKIKFRTKASFIDNLLKHDGRNQVKVTFSLNTDFVNKNYEPGTSTPDEMIAAINALSTKPGYEIDIAIEPIIKYAGYEKDYKALIGKLKKEVDLSKVSKIKIGTVRYKTRLLNFIKSTHPKSSLFSPSQKLIEPQKGDKRWRYSKEERIKIYRIIKDELTDVPHIFLGLGSENPEIWDELQLKKSKIHTDTLHQYIPISVQHNS